MFGLGWSEVLVIATIAILVVPPKDLPGLMRNVGRWVGKVRRMARDFQRQVEDAVRDDEIDQLRKQVSELNRDANAELRRGIPPYQRPTSVVTNPEGENGAPAMTPLPAAEDTRPPPLPAEQPRSGVPVPASVAEGTPEPAKS